MHERGDGSLQCALMDAFDGIEASYKASRNRLLVYFGLVAKNGPGALTVDQCHLADAKNKIYEFIAGKLRVLCFQGANGQVVVCTHMFLKKTQKAPPKEVAKAVKAKQAYLAAEAAGQIEWRDEI